MSGFTSPQTPSVLFATDFSASAAPAAEVARAEARRRHARLHVVHVVRAAAYVAEAQREVAAAAAGLATGDPAVPAVRVGSPAAEIVRYADEHEVELIVVGGHGRTGVTQALLGSVAERVARTATRPVLVVPLPRPEGAGPAPARCIVCGTPSEDLVCEPCRANLRAAAGAPTWAARAGAPVGELTRAECEEVLRTALIGRIACHAGGRLYVLPMAYAYEEGALFMRFSDGLKVRMMRESPSVCLQVDHIVDLANWRSVIVWGTFHELHGQESTDGLGHVLRKLAAWAGMVDGRPKPATGDVDAEAGHRAVGLGRTAVVARVEVTEMTGRYQRR
jgi:nucleotide-binding universal stress UspA family protein/nitroimidazol reductase NimA-like FMN-containing flavoprotein (pyridoxamine 5'-phosphate oxidase superfamily)